MSSMSKGLVVNISLAILSLTLFVGGIEVFLRITGLGTTGAKPLGIYQNSENPHIGYELIPNHTGKAFRSNVITNSLGFRGPELDTEKPLIAVLGDSMIFGYGVEYEESFPAQLQQYLPHYTVLNAGVAGYSLEQEAATYVDKIKILEPEAIILGFFYNDLGAQPPSKLDENGILRPYNWTSDADICTPQKIGTLGFIPGSCWLYKNSTLFVKLKKVADLLRIKRQIANDKKEYASGTVETLDEDLVTRYETELDQLVAQMPPDLIRIFLIVPDHIEHPHITPMIVRLAKERGFYVINAEDAFTEENPPEVLGWDLHPNAKTLARGAEYAAMKLKEDGILE